MAVVKTKKGFTLIELLFAAALFSAAMVGIIALVSSSINTINQSQKIKIVNNAIRNINEYLGSDIKDADCVKGSEDGLEIYIYDNGCVNLQKSIIVDSTGYITEETKNQDKKNLLPQNVRVSNMEGSKLFVVSDTSLVSIKARFTYSGDNRIEYDYQTAIARRRW